MKEDSHQRIPALCRFWCNLYKKLPIIQIGRLEVQLSILTMVVLTIMRYSVDRILYYFGWPEANNDTIVASSSLVAMFHSLNLVPTLAYLLSYYPYRPSEKLGKAPVWWQLTTNSMLQFCTGYMLYDTILNIIYLKQDKLDANDALFLGHHLATSFYMTTARYYQAGHSSAMMCMFLGECTNPFHNLHNFIQLAIGLEQCCSEPWTQILQKINTFCFGATYVAMRGFIGPLVCLHMTYDLWKHRPVPLLVLILWTIMIWGVILGSIPWIYSCWDMIDPRIPSQEL